MKISRRLRICAALVVTASLIASITASRAAQRNQDQKVVGAIMKKMKTVCVGRLLIDLPVEAEISFSPARLGSVDITVRSGSSPKEVAAVIAERETSLVGELNEYDRPSLEKRVMADAINLQGTLIYSGREKAVSRISADGSVANGEEGITVEAFAIKDDLFYRFKGKGLSSPKHERNVLDLVERFESRTAETIPALPGFCVENGIIHDPISPAMRETVTMFASLKGHPDIAIRLDTSVFSRPQESLLARDERNDINARFASNIKNLGKGSREQNGLQGEEVLDRVKERNGTTGHTFMRESPGKGADVLAPNITLELQTGKGRPGEPLNSSLSDEGVMQLWKAISSSLRIRPNAATQKLPPTALCRPCR